MPSHLTEARRGRQEFHPSLSTRVTNGGLPLRRRGCSEMTHWELLERTRPDDKCTHKTRFLDPWEPDYGMTCVAAETESYR